MSQICWYLTHFRNASSKPIPILKPANKTAEWHSYLLKGIMQKRDKHLRKIHSSTQTN